MNLPSNAWVFLTILLSSSRGILGADGHKDEYYYEEYEDEVPQNATDYELNVPESFRTYLEQLLTKENVTDEVAKEVDSSEELTGTTANSVVKNEIHLNNTLSSHHENLSMDKTLHSLANTLQSIERMNSSRPQIYHPYGTTNMSQLINSLGSGHSISHYRTYTDKNSSPKNQDSEGYLKTVKARETYPTNFSKEATSPINTSGLNKLSSQIQLPENESNMQSIKYPQSSNSSNEFISTSNSSDNKLTLGSTIQNALVESLQEQNLNAALLNKSKSGSIQNETKNISSFKILHRSVSPTATSQNMNNQTMDSHKRIDNENVIEQSNLSSTSNSKGDSLQQHIQGKSNPEIVQISDNRGNITFSKHSESKPDHEERFVNSNNDSTSTFTNFSDENLNSDEQKQSLFEQSLNANTKQTNVGESILASGIESQTNQSKELGGQFKVPPPSTGLKNFSSKYSKQTVSHTINQQTVPTSNKSTAISFDLNGFETNGETKTNKMEDLNVTKNDDVVMVSNTSGSTQFRGLPSVLTKSQRSPLSSKLQKTTTTETSAAINSSIDKNVKEGILQNNNKDVNNVNITASMISNDSVEIGSKNKTKYQGDANVQSLNTSVPKTFDSNQSLAVLSQKAAVNLSNENNNLTNQSNSVRESNLLKSVKTTSNSSSTARFKNENVNFISKNVTKKHPIAELIDSLIKVTNTNSSTMKKKKKIKLSSNANSVDDLRTDRDEEQMNGTSKTLSSHDILFGKDQQRHKTSVTNDKISEDKNNTKISTTPDEIIVQDKSTEKVNMKEYLDKNTVSELSTLNNKNEISRNVKDGNTSEIVSNQVTKKEEDSNPIQDLLNSFKKPSLGKKKILKRRKIKRITKNSLPKKTQLDSEATTETNITTKSKPKIIDKSQTGEYIIKPAKISTSMVDEHPLNYLKTDSYFHNGKGNMTSDGGSSSLIGGKLKKETAIQPPHSNILSASENNITKSMAAKINRKTENKTMKRIYNNENIGGLAIPVSLSNQSVVLSTNYIGNNSPYRGSPRNITTAVVNSSLSNSPGISKDKPASIQLDFRGTKHVNATKTPNEIYFQSKSKMEPQSVKFAKNENNSKDEQQIPGEKTVRSNQLKLIGGSGKITASNNALRVQQNEATATINTQSKLNKQAVNILQKNNTSPGTNLKVAEKNVLTSIVNKSGSSGIKQTHLKIDDTKLKNTTKNGTLNSNQFLNDRENQLHTKSQVKQSADGISSQLNNTDQVINVRNVVNIRNSRNTLSNNNTESMFAKQNTQVTNENEMEGLLYRIYNILKYYIAGKHETNIEGGTNSKTSKSARNVIDEIQKADFSKNALNSSSLAQEEKLKQNKHVVETDQQLSRVNLVQLANSSIHQQTLEGMTMSDPGGRPDNNHQSIRNEGRLEKAELVSDGASKNSSVTQAEIRKRVHLAKNDNNLVNFRGQLSKTKNSESKFSIGSASTKSKDYNLNVGGKSSSAAQLGSAINNTFVHLNNDAKSRSSGNHSNAFSYEGPSQNLVKVNVSEFGKLVGRSNGHITDKVFNQSSSNTVLRNETSTDKDDPIKQYSQIYNNTSNTNGLESPTVNIVKSVSWNSNADVQNSSGLGNIGSFQSYTSKQYAYGLGQSLDQNPSYISVDGAETLSQKPTRNKTYSMDLINTKQTSHQESEYEAAKPLGGSLMKRRLPKYNPLTLDYNGSREETPSYIPKDWYHKQTLVSKNFTNDLTESGRLHIIITPLDKKPNISLEISVENKNSSAKVNPLQLKYEKYFNLGNSMYSGDNKTVSKNWNSSNNTSRSFSNVQLRGLNKLKYLKRYANQHNNYNNENNNVLTKPQVTSKQAIIDKLEDFGVKNSYTMGNRIESEPGTINEKSSGNTNISDDYDLDVKKKDKVTNRKRITKKEEVVEINEKMKESKILGRSKTVQTIKTEVSAVDYD